MIHRIHMAALAIFSVGSMAGGALAEDSQLQIVIGGEAYDGAPRYAVSFDGTILGEAEVRAAIDTVADGTFADAADKGAHVQSFDFAIPEDVFTPGGEVRVRLLNEAWGGEGSTHDRNLYLASVAVNGQAVTVSGLETRGTRDDVANEVLGEFLVLRDGNVEGVSRPPETGWPLPGAVTTVAAVDDAEALQQPAKTDALPRDTLAAAAPAEPEAAAEMVVETARVEAPAAPADRAATACTRDEIYNVVGFNENSNDLTPKLTARLDQIVADIGNESCRLLVTGYSSRQGDHATNALFAIERAQNVLGYLREKGVPFERATATGGGATEEFGESYAANRRVVIAVTP
ncbi:OmpA family protein [Devosia sp.]|uniref:OmpA family protein n=1 Tax=Devosia sp. TaxID=1871048 RepID=UPI003A92709F